MLKHKLRSIKFKLIRLYSLKPNVIIFLAYKILIHKPFKLLLVIYNRNQYRAQINSIVRTSTKGIIIYPPNVSWNIPLFQRCQQLAMCLASKDYGYFFCSDQCYDNFKGIQSLSSYLYLIANPLFTLLLKINTRKILILQPNTLRNFSLDFINAWLQNNNMIIYDYLDDLNEKIFGVIESELLAKHIAVLSDERIVCLATAKILYEFAAQYRSNNLYYIPNGVNLNHYNNKNACLPKHWQDLVIDLRNKQKKIIGYFGAIAQWLDYELLIKIATQHPNKIFLLIGHYYDGHYKNFISEFSACNNVIFTGSIEYRYLPTIAELFDISIIPFVIDSVTNATSPVKLFEYMALGKPIISTALPECKQYRSAIIANSHQEFSDLIDVILNLKANDDYFLIQQQEARESSWENRSKKILEICEIQLA